MSVEQSSLGQPQQAPGKDQLKTPAKIDGARRMGVSFNPDKDSKIDILKAKFAELHDLIDLFCSEHTPKVDDAISRQETGRACAISLTDLQKAKWAAVEAITR